MNHALFRVGVARCESYNPEEVYRTLSLAIERAGGLPPQKGNKLLLKANLLAPRPPEEAVTTHPEILRALARTLSDRNQAVSLTVADSPGYIFQDQWEELFRKTGMATLREEPLALEVVPLISQGLREVAIPAGKTLKKARIASLVLSADQVYSVAKLKTHVETEMTGCIKNLFGIADTATRKAAHCAASLEWLAQGVMDLFTIRPPDFCVLDAIQAMEGDGPSRGKPVLTGWILVGSNALAVDMVASRIMGYKNPMEIPLLRVASSRGVGPSSPEEVELVGANLEEIEHPGFRKSSGRIRWIPTSLRGLVHGLVALNPVLKPERCTRCGICAKVCPVDAITVTSTGPHIERSVCVKCLCCHEMCPEGAMDVEKNILARLL